MINIRNPDLRSYAVISLLVLWASLTFSIALTEISFVCALIFWLGWRIRDRRTLSGLSSPSATNRWTDLRQKAWTDSSKVVWRTPALSGGNVFAGDPSCGFPLHTCGNDKSRRIDWAFWAPLALFFACVLISFFTSEYPKQSLRGLLKIAKPLLTFLMAIDLFRDTRSQKRFDGIFLATFLLVTIDCSIQYAFGKDILRGFAAEHSAAGIRLIGPFGNFAKMATYLVLVIPVFGMRFWSDFTRPEHRKRSFYALALAMVGFVLLYLTRCRGPIVALVIGFLILFICKRWFKVLGIAFLLGLVLLAIVPREVIIHQNAQGKEQSIGERQVLWRRAIDVIVAKPLFGTGINTYDRSHAKYDTLLKKKYSPVTGPSVKVRQNQNGSVSFITGADTWTSDEKQKVIRIAGREFNIHRDSAGRYSIWDDLVARGYYAHNGYLQLAAEIGLPGIFFFLLFLFMFFRRVLGGLGAIRGFPEEYARLGLSTGLLAFLIYAAGDNNLQSPPSLMFFWFSAGILMARQSADRAGGIS